MSRIDELASELCPAGVPYIRVGDAATVVVTQPGVKRTEYAEGTEIAIVDQGQGLIAGRTDDHALKIPDGEYIVFGDHTRAVKWIDFPFAVGADGTKVLRADERFVSKFVFYAMANLVVPDRGYNRHWSVVREMRIPMPPLMMQQEIVRMLDQFTQLELELEAELKARRIQYEHYRDSLLASVLGPRVAMGELGTFMRGRRFTKKDVVESGIPSLHYGEIYTDYGVSASRARRDVDPSLERSLRFAKPRDVVFAGVGETVLDVGKAVAWLGDTPVAVHDDTFSFTSSLDPKYVVYASQTEEFQAQKTNHVARGKVKRLGSAGLSKIRIPVPSTQDQARIVSTLDSLDALVNDLSIGIPAELAARRKQYEYYRDRLLTFEERAA